VLETSGTALKTVAEETLVEGFMLGKFAVMEGSTALCGTLNLEFKMKFIQQYMNDMVLYPDLIEDGTLPWQIIYLLPPVDEN
jgi:hypothetical protein